MVTGFKELRMEPSKVLQVSRFLGWEPKGLGLRESPHLDLTKPGLFRSLYPYRGEQPLSNEVEDSTAGFPQDMARGLDIHKGRAVVLDSSHDFTPVLR